MHRTLLWIVTLLLVLAGAILVRALRPEPEKRPAEVLADTIRVLREAAESCRTELDRGERRLHAFDAHLDSLRDRVRDFEALDPRGVPADSYDVYLEAFAQYNDSAAGWQGRTDSLQARLARCRAVTERHNQLADSLRRMLIEQQPDPAS